MRLVETDEGFVLRPDEGERDGRAFAKSLLEFLRQEDLAFLIGGAMERDILTIAPLTPQQRAALRARWAAPAAG